MFTYISFHRHRASNYLSKCRTLCPTLEQAAAMTDSVRPGKWTQTESIVTDHHCDLSRNWKFPSICEMRAISSTHRWNSKAVRLLLQLQWRKKALNLTEGLFNLTAADTSSEKQQLSIRTTTQLTKLYFIQSFIS